MVLKQLNDFLAENGVQPIEAVGQKFDPNLHEAIAHEPSEKVPEDVVIRRDPPRLSFQRSSAPTIERCGCHQRPDK